MYTEKLLSVEALFLDPNNPRLATNTTIQPNVPDPKIEAFESELEKRFTDSNRGKSEDDEGGFDISDLLDSISKLGFQGIDQVVVRPIAGRRGKYVVIEGNRRVASIKLLLKQDASTEVAKDRGEHGRL